MQLHSNTGMTSLLHSTPVKTSSRPILTGLRVLVNSLELTTSLSMMMPNLWYMQPEVSNYYVPLVHEKLDEFFNQGIIVPVEESTDLVSSLAYSLKANRKLQVCLDPKDFNTAIRHDHYKTPTVEDIP